MRFVQSTAFVLALLILSPVSISAQDEPDSNTYGRWGFGFMGGPSIVYLGGADADHEFGQTDARYDRHTGVLGLSVSYGVTRWLAIQMELLYVNKGATAIDSLGGMGAFRLNYLDIPLLVRAEYSLTPTIRVYGLTGPVLGVLDNAKSQGSSGNSIDVTEMIHRYDPGMVIAVGLAYLPFHRHELAFEVRYAHGFTTIDNPPDDAPRRTLDNQTRSISFLLGFRYGQGPVRGSGASESVETREPVGETAAGPGDTDGDEDGVIGAADRCPGEAEDRDGFEDEDGCPDPDNDGDGVADGEDACPGEFAARPGGCPYRWLDVEWSRLGAEEHALRTRQPLEFERGATLASGAAAILDEVAVFLAEHPTLRLRIEGHSDAGGNPASKRAASLRRARAVRDALVGRGVAADRLAVAGLGDSRLARPDEPLAAANRRVELVIPAATANQE